MKEIIYLNGKLICAQEVKISPLGPGFLCGWGLFETMRSCNSNIVYLNKHLVRLKKSAALLDMDLACPLSRIKHLAIEAVRRCESKDVRLRIALWDSGSSTEFMISAKPYRPPQAKKYRRGFSACVSSLRQIENYFPSRIKLLSRILYELSYRQARANKFDEAVILNNRGYICEASRSNIFFIEDETLFTPSLKCSCLPGISRQVVFDLAKKQAIPVVEGNFTIEDLRQAQGAFLTNALIGIMPLTKIGSKLINNRRLHRITRLFIQQYRLLLKRRA